LKHHEDFLPKIKEIWGKPITAQNATEKWCIKLGRVRKFLKGWGDSLRGHTKKYRLILKKELAEIEEVEEGSILTPTLLGRSILSKLNFLDFWRKRSYTGIRDQVRTGY
jgi:hypothetical protein